MNSAARAQMKALAPIRIHRHRDPAVRVLPMLLEIICHAKRGPDGPALFANTDSLPD